ncbi:hypothetical protein C8J57DRAFT_1728092 [Mycena rebaudengoi]|nr:hypothetical protein C8J57DRAFT_1728092 [Mycena rebaudengoi]
MPGAATTLYPKRSELLVHIFRVPAVVAWASRAFFVLVVAVDHGGGYLPRFFFRVFMAYRSSASHGVEGSYYVDGGPRASTSTTQTPVPRRIPSRRLRRCRRRHAST